MQLRIEVPFYPSWATPGQPEGIHCLEMSLKMVLGYFEPGKEYLTAELEKITAKQPEKGSWEMPFSIWFENHGFEVKHYSTFDYEAFMKRGISYIREAFGNEVANWQLANSDVAQAQSQVEEYLAKVRVVPKKPTIEDIRKEMRNGYVIKAMVDSGYLNDKGKYAGHSVVVTGLDDKSVWFHDPGLPPLENRQVKHKRFQEAMDKFGSEMDAIKKRG